MAIEIGAWLSAAAQRLKPSSEDAALEARALLSFYLGKSSAWLMAHPEYYLSGDQHRQLNEMVDRLAEGEPLAYLTGEREFFGLAFHITPAVLVPRPETELLVELALDWLSSHPQKIQVCDVGTGSACIAAALAVNAARIQITAIDRSFEALRVARMNIMRHKLQRRVSLLQADLLTSVANRFDLICANLPYIPTAVYHSLAVARHEPRLALDGGNDGLHAIQRLLQSAPQSLAEGGLMLLEIDTGQAAVVPRLAEEWVQNADVRLFNDLAGSPRVVWVELKPPTARR